MNSYEEEELYDDFENMPQFQGRHANLDLLQGITNYGFEQPSEIQKKTIVPLFMGNNVIGQAQSGRGKTGAFVIGSLSRIDTSMKDVQVIVLSNTHELATQTYNVVSAIGQRMFKDTEVELCIGRQISTEENISNIRKGRKVLVGTPGRIKHLVKHQVNGSSLIDPRNVKVVVLDEADCLLMDKFQDVVIDIIDALDVASRPQPIQLAIFSATFSEDSLSISRKLCVPEMSELGENWTKDPNAPVEVLIPVEDLTLEGIEQYYYEIDCAPRETFDQKAEFIMALNDIQMIPMCIIYVNNKNTADRLKRSLDKAQLSSQCIYGSLTPSQRSQVTAAFRKCETRILISTDLLARGFDVQQVELVINFDLPYVHDRNTAEINKEKMAEYLHRIGRGGRFGRRGLAINIIASATERTRKEAIEQYFNTTISTLPDDVSGLY
jgi:translation initiation factor 4A